MVLILAGYENDMNNLMRANEGLSSRFADEILFPSLTPVHCLRLLEDILKQSQISFPSMQESATYHELLKSMAEMSKLPSWGNARDVQTLAKGMVRSVYQSSTTKTNHCLLPAETALECIHSMLDERCARAQVTPSFRSSPLGPTQSLDDSQPAPRMSSSTSTTTKTTDPDPEENHEASKISRLPGSQDEARDVGVSDAAWEQLRKDDREAQLQTQQVAQRIQEQEEARHIAEEAEKEAEKASAALGGIQAKSEAEAIELLRLRDEARIREMEAKAERERIQRALERRKREVEERLKREALVQSRLRQMGVCVAGFSWIKQAGGYKCSAGGHWVDDSQLEI